METIIKIHTNKGRKFSEEHRRKIGLANLNPSKETRDKLRTSHLGKHLSEETKKKISESKKGQYPSEETRKKMSESSKSHLLEVIEKILNSRRGYKHSEETKRKQSEAAKLRKRYPLTEEHKKKISVGNIGKNKGKIRTEEYRLKSSLIRKGKKLTTEHKLKISKALKGKMPKNIKQLIFSSRKIFRGTKPELQMKEILTNLNQTFIFQYPVKNIKHAYPADFYIPNLNLIIEVDGKHWHNYPVGKEKDKIRTQEMQEKGYKVLRFWEKEFNLNSVKEQLNNCIPFSQKETCRTEYASAYSVLLVFLHNNEKNKRLSRKS